MVKKEIIEEIERQRDELLRESEDNFVEFENKLREKFDSSLDFNGEVQKWKKQVESITENYTNSRNKIKQAFILLNEEEDKNLVATGRTFKKNMSQIVSKTETLMQTYLNEYKIERKLPKDKPFFVIYNPTLDIESNLFSEDVSNQKESNAKRRFSNLSINNVTEQASYRKTSNVERIEVHYDDNDFFETDLVLTKELTEKKKNKKNDDNLFTDLSMVEMPELNESKVNRIPDIQIEHKVKQFNPQQQFYTPKTTFMKSFDFRRGDGFPSSQTNLPDFRRAKSPMSSRNILMSPIRRKRQNTTQHSLYAGKNDNRKSRDKVSEYSTQKRTRSKNKSYSHIKTSSGKRKGRDVSEASKSKTLRKLLNGRHGEVVQDLKRGGVINFDLTFAGWLNRLKRQSHRCNGRSYKGE